MATISSPRCYGQLAQRQDNGGEREHSEVVPSGFFEAGCDPAELLELAEAAPDPISCCAEAFGIFDSSPQLDLAMLFALDALLARAVGSDRPAASGSAANPAAARSANRILAGLSPVLGTAAETEDPSDGMPPFAEPFAQLLDRSVDETQLGRAMAGSLGTPDSILIHHPSAQSVPVVDTLWRVSDGGALPISRLVPAAQG